MPMEKYAVVKTDKEKTAAEKAKKDIEKGQSKPPDKTEKKTQG